MGPYHGGLRALWAAAQLLGSTPRAREQATVGSAADWLQHPNMHVAAWLKAVTDNACSDLYLDMVSSCLGSQAYPAAAVQLAKPTWIRFCVSSG